MPRTAGGAFTLADDDRTPRARRWGCLVTLALVAVTALGGWWGVRRAVDAWSPTTCEVRAGGKSFTWAPDQASNSAVITAIALRRGMAPRAATIAIATALQESKVRNITFGDRDSVGLFQQRPSQGWGTVEQIMNPEYSSNAFYDALEKVPDWENADIAHAAQEVQRSADGSAYAQHEAKARVTASVLAGYSPAGIGCRLDSPKTPGSPQALVTLIAEDHGVTARVEGNQVVIDGATDEQAWSLASWGVARAIDTGVTAVVLGDQQWTRSKSGSALTWHGAGTPVGARTVVLSLG